jgi:cytochrome c oxidase subunit 2
MFWSRFHHRKSRGAVSAQFHESTVVEVIWTIIPLLILVGMAIPATQSIIAMEDTRNADMTVKVTGYQWKWQYDYLDEGLKFFSTLDAKSNEARQLNSGIDPASVENYLLNVDNPVVLPVNKKIRFLVTAADVLHAWWVPALGIKRDAIPGFVYESWAAIEKPGIYRGQCAELCGKDHGYMPIVVIAKEESGYKQWVAEMKTKQASEAAAGEKAWSKDELMARGEAVYNTACAACHQANGQGIPGAIPGIVKGGAFSGTADMTKPLQDLGFWEGGKIVLGSVPNHIKVVLKGVPGTGMGAFAEQLNDTDIAAVVTYERNAWGNNTGDVIQPAQVKVAR